MCSSLLPEAETSKIDGRGLGVSFPPSEVGISPPRCSRLWQSPGFVATILKPRELVADDSPLMDSFEKYLLVL